MQVRWLDGQSAEGQFVLEIMFSGGGMGYMKSKTYEQACQNYDNFWNINPEIVGMTLYNLEGKVVANKTRMEVV
jgi:hypothetical protein